MDKNAKVYLAGHTGMVGSALFRNLIRSGYYNVITRELDELNLIDQSATAAFFESEKPEYVLLAAARVGGIHANNVYRAQFIYENIQIQTNVIHQAYLNGVKKLLFLGSSCIYPAKSPQPIKEEYLLTDILEYTNEPYAIAKITGIKMCESYNIQYGTNFISAMPTNLFGINDNYDLDNSHVLPALIRKMHLAKLLQESDFEGITSDLSRRPVPGFYQGLDNDGISVLLKKYGIEKKEGRVILRLWGSGSPSREFLDSDSLAAACIFLMENIDYKHTLNLIEDKKNIRNTHINIGSGTDLTILELAEKIKNVTGYEGILGWDSSKPDGTVQKLLDITKLRSLGWSNDFDLDEKLRFVYDNYKSTLGIWCTT
ncbi:MAG: GDP-L-fucose synthase [Bacteroidetes bacterium]|nr:GDP-L-fucose synthase [Bacteroidota bacterium]MBU1719760.1 GDP-L-fucose synthase [Bacteroidota bacterium]